MKLIVNNVIIDSCLEQLGTLSTSLDGISTELGKVNLPFSSSNLSTAKSCINSAKNNISNYVTDATTQKEFVITSDNELKAEVEAIEKFEEE